ncbi:glucose PTS transporter transcription antiterminator GlcT [Bacillus cytotoxicus]|uniref:Transcriptional antiterminator, BglG n=1 Tax=Bacillus cytotoxicus (strain DSM 22905 / CIP 110041 / 391-98 / NVH 391-98) TaxID=315749 RepID=A7GS75_BACCN|nr:transcription antiterminator [Bacillus cytotoxicus]ABS22983.1 transcriptional antiterminator, BglG [Bacillus cytotoxicus NVH 391-98]AWC45614.1 transcription antiterminator [Bacillus cytotoxicus]MDH2863506.1 transcription antiterminator [Bacillus cytotoxicus]MDH2884292.1 transcription antiterminator [Bacillus cytotoxicus]NZD32387.1 transcription antiterminator [Bacillus cytotoxicus]
MNNCLEIKKVLNNNVIIANHPEHKEVVVIGKGIGFGKKAKDVLEQQQIEKMFILKNEHDREQYKLLVPHVSEQFIALMNDIMLFIQEKAQAPLNEHIHIALTDHISFALKRLKQGLTIDNPFLVETKMLYPKEYEIAAGVVQMLNSRLQITLPEGEIGFIALHIYSSLTNSELASVNQNSRLIVQLVTLIETNLHLTLDPESIHYLRLIRHLQYAIERVKKGEKVEEAQGFADLLKAEYPVYYNLAWKLVKVMQKELQLPVYEAESIYLTMHLQRLVKAERV